MDYTPKPNEKITNVLTVVTFSLGIIAFALANVAGKFHGILQLVGFVLLGCALFLILRYRMTSYRYLISDEDGDAVFTVYKNQGRRSVAECRMSLSYLESAVLYRDKGELIRARRGMKNYAYVASMEPEMLCLLVFTTLGSDIKTSVTFEPDMKFYSALSETAKRAKFTSEL